METVTVRDLSSEVITRATAQGQMLGITNRGALAGVLLPLTRQVLERLARRDAEQIAKEVHYAEVEMASGDRLGTLDDLEADQDRPSDETSVGTSFTRVTIRGLTGKRLDQAASDGKAMLVTSDGATVALLIPVTAKWMERLVEAGIRRFLDGGSPVSAATVADAEQVTFDSAVLVPSISRQAVSITEPSVAAVTRGSGRSESAAGVSFAVIGSPHDFLRSVAIGIEITSDTQSEHKRLVGVVTDMLAKVESAPRERILESVEERHVLNQILGLVEDLQLDIGSDRPLIGIGLEIGGHVHNGRVVYSPNAQWSQFPLGDRLANLVKLPVVLENDANALAIYERRFSGIEDRSFAVVILTDVGLGCGLMLDGQIYHGTRGMAGELGHVPVAMGDPSEYNECRCVNRGCLETAATPHAISLALPRVGFNGTYSEALGAAESEPVVKAFGAAGASLGRALAGVINLMNPSALIFYGPTSSSGRHEHSTLNPNEMAGSASRCPSHLGFTPKRW